MTNKIRLILAVIVVTGLLAAGGLARGQTNTNSPTGILPGGVSQLGTYVLNFFKDSQPYFTNGARLGLYGLYGLRNPASDTVPNPKRGSGGFLDLSFPTPAGPQLSLDFALGFVTDGHTTHVYDAALAPTLGTTWDLPVIGKSYTWLSTGPAYDFQTHSAVLHSAMGLTKGWTLWGVQWAGTVGALKLSDHTGTGWFAGLSGNWKIPGS